MDKSTTEIESIAFKSLISHLQKNTDVQNIDLMILAGFCRNCLAKWLVSAAEEKGQTLSIEDAREEVYGMPYDEWKSKHQKKATPEQLAAFEQRQAAK